MRTKKPITEHGISMYRYRNCRCETCAKAAAEQRKQFRKPRTDNKNITLDGTPLLQRLEQDGRIIAIHTAQRDKWRTRGINIYSADSWCIKLGYHPVEIWGNDFYQQCEEELVEA